MQNKFQRSNIQKPQVESSSTYVPNYQRLGVDPIKVGVPLPEFRKGKPAQIKQPAFMTKPQPVEKPVYIKASLPQSGKNQEQAWANNAVLENDDVNQVAKYANQEIEMDEITQVDHEPFDEDNSFNLEQVDPNNYCLFIDNQLIHQTVSLEDMEVAISYILTDPESPFEGVDIGQMRVFKDFPLKTGITIG